MRIQQKRFAVLDDSVSIFEIRLAFANRFDFGTSEGNTGFEFIEQKVVMSRGTIDRSVALTGGDWFPRLRFLRGWIGRLTLLPGHTFGYESSC
jgi:hypothetical protein